MKRPFVDFVETLDYLQACRILIHPDGTFSCPDEEEGRITKVSPTTRRRLAMFLVELADRLRHPDRHPPKGPRN